jgi:5'-methylthioadenosine nucleosidase
MARCASLLLAILVAATLQIAPHAQDQAFDLAELRPKKILIVMAMSGEAGPIIRSFGLTENKRAFGARDPMQAFEGRVGKTALIVVLNGKNPRPPHLDLTGPTAAAVTTSQAIKTFSPGLVINAGTAGGLGSRGVKVGDVVLSQQIVFHDRRIPLGPAWEEYALGNYPHARTQNAASALGLKTAVVATGSSFVNVSTSDLKVINSVEASVVEMEAAAVAEICAIYKTKMVALKAITDDVEHPALTQFDANFQLANTNLEKKMRELVAYLQRP